MENRHMLPYYAAPTQLQPNPEGMAAVGAIAGLIVGGITGSLITYWFRPKVSVDAFGDTPEEAMEQASAEAQELLRKWKIWRRVSYLVNGTLATAGAGVGARMGASPRQKDGAMWGAMIGAGIFRMVLNPLINPSIGFPGLIGGGLGAYLGARRAR
jgi:hypothetical protein